MRALTVIRTFGFRFRMLGIVGLISLLGIAPSLLYAQQTQSELQASLAMHEDEVVKQEDETIAGELQQVIEIDMIDVSIEYALKEIAQKANMKLMYSKASLPAGKTVTLKRQNITLCDALWTVLEDTGIRFGLSQNRQLVLLKIQEPESTELLQETITGTVTDAQSGEALPSVNVSVKGTGIGTSTNDEGRYELTNVPSLQDTLMFSFVGYQTREIPIGGRTTINVELTSQAVEGEEVVVTAFGMEREQKALGYSTQELGGDELTVSGESNLVSSLAGKVAGAQVSMSPSPGGSSGIIIRGASSLTGNNQPLIVVDGVPIDNQSLDAADATDGIDYGDGIGSLNPDNIENVSVLKGPNAAALYGSRAANGAVVITTKSGSASTSGIGLTFNSNVSVEQLSTRPQFQEKWAGGYGDDWSSYGTTTIDGEEYPVWPSWLLDNWGPAYDEADQVVIGTMPELGPVQFNPLGNDNINKFYETGVKVQNTLSYSGGDETTTYRFSVSNLNNTSIVPNSAYSRNSVSVRVTSSISDRLTVDGKANYVRQDGENRPMISSSEANPFQNLTTMPHFVDLDWLRDYKREDGTPRNWKADYPMNPFWVANEIQNEDTRDRIIGFVSADYNFTEWLNLRVKAGMDTYNDDRFRRVAPGTPGESRIDGVVENNTYKVRENNANFLLTANQDFAQDFSAEFSVGGNYMFRETKQTGIRGENLNISGLYHINNARLTTPISSHFRKEIQSLYGMGQIGYRDYLFLDVTGRNDWSSTLPEDNSSFFYPSVSLSFVLSDAFSFDSSFMTFGKLRASYAQTGSDSDPYLTNIGYNISTANFRGHQMGSIQETIPARNLKNELTSSYEFGADLRFFNNRLRMDFTYYNSSTTNQIFSVDVSEATGFGQRVINAGEIQNDGVELMVNTVPIQTEDFGWELTMNYSKNRSEVASLAPGVESISILTATADVGFDASDGEIHAVLGEPFGSIVGFPYRRNEAGEIWLTEQGTPTRAEETAILGNIQPDWLGGVTNTFRYKGFSLSTLLDIRQGGEIYSQTKYEQMAKGTGKFTEDRENLVFDGVIQNEDGSFSENTTEILSQQYYAFRAWQSIGEEFIVDASYISLREASIGYSFSSTSSFIENTPFIGLNVNIVGRNLFYLDRADVFETMGVDPQSAYNRSAAAQGFESRTQPLTRTISFDLNLEF